MTPKINTKDQIGYVRVSRRNGREGPRFISPDIQRESIETHARPSGREVVWVEEYDRSGGAGKKRPEFEALLARVEAGEVDKIIVWKISRFGRSLIESALRIQKIEQAGGVVESATEGAQSKLTRNIMLAIAEDELDRLTESWAISRERAFERGVWIGAAPFGYVRDEDGKLHEDPKWGKVVREAFRRAGRDGIAAATTYLRAKAPQRKWTSDSTRKLLRTRTYLGESRLGEIVNPKAHPALTTLEDWTAAQSAPRPRRANGRYPLSGIARCGECGGGLKGQLQSIDGRTYRRYRCANKACRGGSSINADKLDALAYDALHEALSDEDWRATFVPGDIAAARQKLEDARNEVVDFTDKTPASSSAYAYGLAKREAIEAEALATFRAVAAHQAAESRDLPTAEQLRDPAKFDAALRRMVAKIVVARGRGPIGERVRLRWRRAPRRDALDHGVGELASL